MDAHAAPHETLSPRVDDITVDECDALLRSARLIVLSPSGDEEAPVDVALYWLRDRPYFPLPGSTLWRTALQRWLRQPSNGSPEDGVIRTEVERSLVRFPSIESWWDALRSGWTRPTWLPVRRPDARGA